MSKNTHISGYVTKEGKPDIRVDYAAYKAWQEKSFRQFILTGHWNLEKAIAYAEKKGLRVDVRISHKVFGFKTWQCGVDRQWHLDTITSAPVAFAVTDDDNEGCAQSMMDACDDVA